jgi:ribose transport system permease protein
MAKRSLSNPGSGSQPRTTYISPSREPAALAGADLTSRVKGTAREAASNWRQNVIYLAFLATFLVFSITLAGSGFLTSTNLLNIGRQTATISIMSVAMTFVISAAEIDLSVGSVAGLASVLTALTLPSLGLVPSIAIGLATGAAAGLLNGVLVVAFKIPSFLVTLGTLGIANGVAAWVSNSSPEPILNTAFNDVFGAGSVGAFPSLLIWTAVFVIAGHVILRKTTFGRGVLATGGNRLAAEYSGIRTRRIKLTVLFASGTVAALAGLLYAGQYETGRFDWGTGAELSVIAAVILGGTNLFGGRGTVLGALFGSLLIGTINNGLLLFGVGTSQQQVVQGVIIILAVALGRRE